MEVDLERHRDCSCPRARADRRLDVEAFTFTMRHLEGVLAAIVGSVLAGGAVLAIVQFFVQGYLAVNMPFTNFVGLADGLLVVPILIGSAIVLAALASGLAIRRYLRI